ncbi:MAG: Lrp/AsnC ligand binding domain-containing protein [Nitrososphaeraceae archaeon]|nr:Lrp/AsnC ligand binding domain-containing protein [Nitrososphaeraceae archaeon]
MPSAYVLINCEHDSEEEIVKELSKLPELVEVYQAYGSYDLIAKISTDTIDKLKETISWSIRRSDKIKSTLTLIVVEGQQNR